MCEGENGINRDALQREKKMLEVTVIRLISEYSHAKMYGWQGAVAAKLRAQVAAAEFVNDCAHLPPRCAVVRRASEYKWAVR